MSDTLTHLVGSAVPMIGRQWFHQWLQWSCPIWTNWRPIDISTTRYWKWASARRSWWTTWWLTRCPWNTWRWTTPQWNWCNGGWCRLTWHPARHCSSWACGCSWTHPNDFYLCLVNKTQQKIWQSVISKERLRYQNTVSYVKFCTTYRRIYTVRGEWELNPAVKYMTAVFHCSHWDINSNFTTFEFLFSIYFNSFLAQNCDFDTVST